ncbi:sucrase ferredoxin [Kribbella deserti]|uniref:Sucrase ferredoxin n=1 Tax=Kribbella deserti TaxID=1926257 RepID=A0ABV6QUD1_9ACTN
MSQLPYRPETGCAATALLRGDNLMATAPPARSWLLIECREPWPRQALTALGEYTERVRAACAEIGCRPALIRRYGRSDPTVPRRWGLVDSRPGRESARWGELRSYADLLDVLAGELPGELSDEPAYLICTHGRHDPCCAVQGRPVAATLATAYPERTWECSHVGGDRFAPNLVVLPHGLYYGHFPVLGALDLATRYDKGLVVPEYFRGRGSFSPPVQAAQHFARAAGASYEVNQLNPLAVKAIEPNRWDVTLAGGYAVQVSARLMTIDAALTCGSASPGQARHFELERLVAP